MRHGVKELMTPDYLTNDESCAKLKHEDGGEYSVSRTFNKCRERMLAQPNANVVPS